MLTYITGDASRPVGKGNKVIPHCCNDLGRWGSGFVVAVSKKWKEPESEYRFLKSYELGDVQFVKVEEDIVVANIIGQHGIKSINNVAPIRYDAIRIGLQKVCEYALKNNASVHMPKIGSDRAGGNWDRIEKIIKEELVDKNIDIYVYIFKTQELI
jgi:O-acetyl-ADP-ribose deacetylase (regulator of RNase III)